MSKPAYVLSIDLGDVGFRGDPNRFKVSLDATALTTLISHAKESCRIYELFLISRPGDILRYIYVIAESLPEWVSQRLKFANKKACNERDAIFWNKEDVVPFIEFDRLFFWDDDDHLSGNNQWMNWRNSDELKAFLRQLFTEALAAQRNLKFADELIKHVVSLIEERAHAYDYLDRVSATVESCG